MDGAPPSQFANKARFNKVLVTGRIAESESFIEEFFLLHYFVTDCRSNIVIIA